MDSGHNKLLKWHYDAACLLVILILKMKKFSICRNQIKANSLPPQYSKFCEGGIYSYENNI